MGKEEHMSIEICVCSKCTEEITIGKHGVCECVCHKDKTKKVNTIGAPFK